MAKLDSHIIRCKAKGILKLLVKFCDFEPPDGEIVEILKRHEREYFKNERLHVSLLCRCLSANLRN